MYEAIDRYVRMLIAESSPARTVWNVERLRQGKPADWNYIDGCMMTALQALADITGERQFSDFVRDFIGSFVAEDGSIRTYKPEKHSLDDINEGRVLFRLWEETGEERFKKAANFLRGQLDAQPRTCEGSFWHKQIYPDQVWLDGIYMAQPFAALYEKTFGTGNYSDILRQVETVEKRMRDPATGLYYHGYDASRSVFWADPETGRSKSFWLRAIGWFSVALADLAEILPAGEARDRISGVFARLMADVRPFADPESGMYYQVVDQGSAPGNYLESSGSAMLAYAMLKGARLGVLPADFAAQGKKTFDGLVSRCLHTDGDRLGLDSICLGAGLGPADNPRRDGTLAYYLSEPVVSNDAKGVAPFLLAYTEIRRL